MHFGFMPGRGTIDAIFIPHSVTEETPWKKEKPLLRLCRFGKGI